MQISLATYDALRHQRVVMVGDARSGKTTFLRHIAFLLARGIEDTKTITLPFPLLMNVRDLAALDSLGQLIGFLQLRSALSRDFLRDRLLNGLCVLLLDGFDDAPQACPLIEEAAASFRHSRFIVTSRPLPGVPLIAGFESLRVEPFRP